MLAYLMTFSVVLALSLPNHAEARPFGDDTGEKEVRLYEQINPLRLERLLQWLSEPSNEDIALPFGNEVEKRKSHFLRLGRPDPAEMDLEAEKRKSAFVRLG